MESPDKSTWGHCKNEGPIFSWYSRRAKEPRWQRRWLLVAARAVMRDKGTRQGGRATEPQLLLPSSLSNFCTLSEVIYFQAFQLCQAPSPLWPVLLPCLFPGWSFRENTQRTLSLIAIWLPRETNLPLKKGSFLEGFHTSRGKWRAKSTAETATLLNSTVWAPQALHPLGEWVGRQLRKKSFRAGSVKRKQNFEL